MRIPRIPRAVQDRILWIHVVAIEVAVEHLATALNQPPEILMVKLLAEARTRFDAYSPQALDRSTHKILAALKQGHEQP